VVRKEEKGVPHLDSFMLTHLDNDHCNGFPEAFYQGNPGDYSSEDLKNKRVRIDELWFSPRIFSTHAKESELSKDAKIFRKEAKRRIKLHKNGDAEHDKPGNRIRIIGYSTVEEAEGLDDVTTVAGEELSEINGVKRDDFKVFVFAPIKSNTDDPQADRNDTSIAVRVDLGLKQNPKACSAIFGGDLGYEEWERIFEMNAKNRNLAYDLFLAPHHCSWTYFNEVGEDEPKDSSIKILKQKNAGAFVVASSKPIKNNDDNPPSYKAKGEYTIIVGKLCFLCTGEHPSEKKPEPITFLVTENGPQKKDPPKSQEGQSKIAINATVSTPKTYG